MESHIRYDVVEYFTMGNLLLHIKYALFSLYSVRKINITLRQFEKKKILEFNFKNGYLGEREMWFLVWNLWYDPHSH